MSSVGALMSFLKIESVFFLEDTVDLQNCGASSILCVNAKFDWTVCELQTPSGMLLFVPSPPLSPSFKSFFFFLNELTRPKLHI